MGNLELSNDTQTDIHLQLYDHARLWTFKAERINEHALDCCYMDVSLSRFSSHLYDGERPLPSSSIACSFSCVANKKKNNNKKRKGKIGYKDPLDDGD